jgi:hypothetical protein
MKKILLLVALISGPFAFSQSESNTKQLQFINAERPLGSSFWVRGEYLEVTLNFPFNGEKIFLMPLAQVEYQLKYELSQGDGQNLWFLYIRCKEGKGCITPFGWPELVIALSEHRERAENVLNGLKTLK